MQLSERVKELDKAILAKRMKGVYLKIVKRFMRRACTKCVRSCSCPPSAGLCHGTYCFSSEIGRMLIASTYVPAEPVRFVHTDSSWSSVEASGIAAGEKISRASSGPQDWCSAPQKRPS